MHRNQFYYPNMSGNFIDCDVEIKTESNSASMTESPLFPLSSLQYDTACYNFNLNSIKQTGIRQFERKHKLINETHTQMKQREENRERMRRFRCSLSDVEKSIRRTQNADHMREFRKNLSDVEKEVRRAKAAEYMREFRRNLSEVERQVRRKLDTERMRKFRSNLTEIEKEIRRQKAKERMRRQRDEIRTRNLERINSDLYTI